MKTISILLALLNSLGAGLVIAASLPAIQILRPASSLWSAVKVACSLGIILAGILTWMEAGNHANQGAILLAGLFLVALGAASLVWTVHLAIMSGSVKDHMFLFGTSLMAQGAASVWTLMTEAK